LRIIESAASAAVDVAESKAFALAHSYVLQYDACPMHRPIHPSPPLLQSNQIDGLVREIVERCLPAARQRIGAAADTMSAGELTGYLRARVMLAVRDQARRTAAAHLGDASVAEQLVGRALDRTVSLLIRELTDERPLVMPMVETPLRAAA
jgi:hypothetical protein